MNNLFQRIESARDLADASGYSSTEVLLARVLERIENLKAGATGDLEITHADVKDAVNRAFGVTH